MRRSLPALIVLAPVLVVGTIYAFVLGMHVRWVAWMRARGLAAPSRGLLDQVRVHAGEVWALLHMLTWRLTSPSARRTWTPDQARGHPVLCVHGYFQDRTAFRRVRRALHARGRITHAVTLTLPPREPARYIHTLDLAIRRLVEETEASQVDVVCHSMGGLVLRAALTRDPSLRDLVGRVVTLGTPHRGTGAARGAVLTLPEPRIMHRAAPWLDHTPALIDLLPGHPVTTIGSIDDATVYPVDSALSDGDRQVRIERVGHTGLLVWWHSVAHVVAALERPMPRPSA